MILPIVAYGDPVLKKEAEEIDEKYPNLSKLIADMFDTMYHAKELDSQHLKLAKVFVCLSWMEVHSLMRKTMSQIQERRGFQILKGFH